LHCFLYIALWHVLSEIVTYSWRREERKKSRRHSAYVTRASANEQKLPHRSLKSGTVLEWIKTRSLYNVCACVVEKHGWPKFSKNISIFTEKPDRNRTWVFISSAYKLVEFSGASFHCFLHGPLSQDVKCSYIDQFGVDWSRLRGIKSLQVKNHSKPLI
jgi:hypothetical protein